ncbi:hypothetical protein A3K29_00605 [Candidatus Collierbacteria bacterium RIFOXYB2_FULL_46_14]|uniref:DinB-like domain-containing protein n=1 Tax=Candidatus Collierbacteria bacterium GW2011_GWA2_46_26 TaxID=1618381 RepID=A0A0G1SIS7_9BACT|nr:MAG: hypothetical protein UW29_C0008G0017 [Candidatus Collierbacteria bacterium GW2011_GWC2_44_13]KKU33215.1 MAG: hypothetical protein UX47_C0005G0017 [Candidatus Collierbacteria bacterium GW2011_GWA2_46_26]OGD72637.1 MAG: hypothetical protein A3K29_00605 [Candidatus Collierbacteria bacterium RIFOXYB2_FULL_46_14]OGD75679.1 MAG: hypothetical protein A3K43_00605 [Candidatus Collierbacteria bacterium RIFOXYA2_FULL_46_20]OGD77015.1 MAG: hypothetical protein A3K39_00605 [Candidatus Collierbacteri
MAEPEIKKLLGEFEKVKEEITRLVGDFPEESRTKIIFDKWSLKDVTAHLSNWMVHDIDCLEKLKKGVEPYWEPSTEEFNRKGIEARKNNTWEEVYGELVRAGNRLTEIYNTLPENLWDKPIWKGYGLTARKFLLQDIDHWSKEHVEELKRKLELEKSDTVTQE